MSLASKLAGKIKKESANSERPDTIRSGKDLANALQSCVLQITEEKFSVKT